MIDPSDGIADLGEDLREESDWSCPAMVLTIQGAGRPLIGLGTMRPSRRTTAVSLIAHFRPAD